MKRKLFAVAVLMIGMFFAQSTQAQTYTYTFTPQFTFPCTGVNQAPLNATDWYSVGIDGPGQLPMYDELEVLGGVCTTTIEVQHDGQASLTLAAGVSTGSQYLGFTIAKAFVANESAAFIYLKSGEPWLAPSLNIALSGTTGVTNGMTLDVVTFDSGSNIIHDFGSVNFTANVGDTVAFAFKDELTVAPFTSEWYFFVNNSLVTFHTCGSPRVNQFCPNPNNGIVGLQLDSIVDTGNVIGVTQIVAGAFNTNHP